METIDFRSKNPKEILNILGFLFEKSRENRDIGKLENTIRIASEIEIKSFNTHSKAIFHYYLGNAWSYIQDLKCPNEEFPLETKELEYEIIHFRKAYLLIKDCKDKFIECQILTNLGNLFSHIGRFSEAQEYFNACLKIDKNFGMALGNRGMALFYYARVIFNPVHQFIFMQYARKDLIKSLRSDQVYMDAKHAFRSIIQQIESSHEKNHLDDFEKYDNYYKDIEDVEVEYRKWCSENRLFINPLNDILTDSIASNDFLFTPSMILGLDEKPVYHSIFNQLKQEFVSARYLFYEALNESEPHFSDKNVTLMDTLDYSVYSLTLEQIKGTFRTCYSIFDKIAYFINLYLKLGYDSNRVNFKNVWYKNLVKQNGLDDRLSITRNWAMRGLFWLSKDFHEKEFESSIELDAKELAVLRNFMEHKSFKIIESFNEGWSEKTETFVIDRTLFYNKTFKLLKLSRSAILYLSFLIFDEERERNKSRDAKKSIPLNFIEINDEDKI
ncbi:MAG: hypothetical protein LWW85_02150 [Marinilabiliales bacterium]|nr:hypothetical protein [Marinilabiliales bacterium]